MMPLLWSLSLILVLVEVSCHSVVPEIPSDNSHYRDGVSRYIWLTNDQGAPILVDLKEPVDNDIFSRNGANNQYLLYTRANRNLPQQIVHNLANTVTNSFYNPNLPLNVLVHGWTGSISSPMNPLLVNAFLTNADCNVIVVDWGTVAQGNYVSAVVGVPSVGEHLGYFLDWLIRTGGGNWSNVHLIGFSLGAHVVGNAGRTVGNRISRITGLDPAGPLWNYNEKALRASDAIYVETIHTNGGVQGIITAIGRASFYPNGGINQPGCDSSQCSHSHAYDLFASTVLYNRHVARLCTDIQQALLITPGPCSGIASNMGNALINKRGYGVFGLQTTARWPFF